VIASDAQLKKTPPEGAGMTAAEARKLECELSKTHRAQVKNATPKGASQWSAYPPEDLVTPQK
jgi:hypothetical protein